MEQLRGFALPVWAAKGAAEQQQLSVRCCHAQAEAEARKQNAAMENALARLYRAEEDVAALREAIKAAQVRALQGNLTLPFFNLRGIIMPGHNAGLPLSPHRDVGLLLPTHHHVGSGRGVAGSLGAAERPGIYNSCKECVSHRTAKSKPSAL